MTEDTWSHGRDGASASGYGRRRFIAVGSGVGATLLAGCTSDDGGDDGTPTDDGGDGSGGGETANFRLLVSDAPADIDDFDRLDVTFSRARVFEGGDGEDEETDDEGTETEDDEQETESEEPDEEGTETENGTDTGNHTETVEEDEQTNENGTDAENGTETGDTTGTENGTETDDEDDGEDDGEGGRGFYVLELDSPTVDLTQVVGDVAQPIFEGELEAGSYQKLELHVEDVEGVVDGEAVEVKVPSNKLQLTKPFEVRAGEELDFVFDINVVKRGNQASYNLKPVISQSGVRGEDVEVEEVGGDGAGDEGEDDDEQGAGSDDGAGSNGTDDEGGAGQGNETGDGASGNESAA